MTETQSMHVQTADKPDAWMPIAIAFREALKQVRPGEYPQCLPGEPDSCGGDAAGHVMATAALLAAIGLHHAEHAGPHRVTEFWNLLDEHRITLARHHGGRCDCDESPANGS